MEMCGATSQHVRNYATTDDTCKQEYSHIFVIFLLSLKFKNVCTLPGYRNRESQWTLSLKYLLMTILSFSRKLHWYNMHATQSNCWSMNSSTLLLSIMDVPLAANPTYIIFRDSCLIITISRMSTRLKKSSSDWSNLVK